MNYCSERMPISKSDANNSYICIFPSIGLKKCGQYEDWLAKFYAQYPHADYYKQHSSTGKRATPGTFTKYVPTKDAPGIINFYVKVYPGNKTYPNDNSVLRIKNFGMIMGALADQQGIDGLHLMIPSKVPSEQQEYLQHIEDYLSTCKLHGHSPMIYLYGCEAPIAQIEQTSNSAAKATKATPVTKPAPKAPTYRLVCDPSQISQLVLYEQDFVKGTTSMESVLKYWNDPTCRWQNIIEDVKLTKEAERIYEKIGNVIGTEDVFPAPDQIFNAFQLLESEPKVVIIGQDPYHGVGQAHGLSFSVQKGIAVPPSLRNIYSALENDPDVDFQRPTHGCLEEWAKQGVIMLNSALTVVKGQPNSHRDIWQNFTDRLITLLSTKYPDLIYVLWGGDAKKKGSHVSKGTTLEYNHPSPMVRGNKFATECRHFSEINKHLEKQGKTPINWQLN